MSQNVELIILTEAAESGIGDAQWELGLTYFNGDGVPQDYVEAYFWLSLAQLTPSVLFNACPTEIREKIEALVPPIKLVPVLTRCLEWIEVRGLPRHDPDFH